MHFLNQQTNQPIPFTRTSNTQSQLFEPDSVITKIANHLDCRQITIQQFWQSERNCASANDIVTFCKNCELYLPQYDVINLKGEIFANKETIYVEQFASYVPSWQSQNKCMVEQFLKMRSDMLLEQLQAKEKKRPKSGFPGAASTTKSFSVEKSRPMTRQASAQKMRRQSNSTKALLIKNHSKEYLKKFREKELNREKELHQSIEKNKIDQEYGMLMKMSELNAIGKEKESSTTYRAYKSAEGTIKVRVFHYNKFEKEISLNEFDTIYKNYKKSTKENKQWTVVHQHNPQKIQDELQNLKNKNIQKSQRQQQLKNLLVGTVNLTNLLKEQIKIFKEKGILGNEHI